MLLRLDSSAIISYIQEKHEIMKKLKLVNRSRVSDVNTFNLLKSPDS